MLRFAVLLLAAGASALPLEDTPEVAEARAAHLAAVEEAKAGLHAALAPVNNDIQAPQIAGAYLDDVEDVAAAKADFLAYFADVEGGALAAKQAPAPVHEVAAPVVAAVHAAPAVIPTFAAPVVHNTVLNYAYPSVYNSYAHYGYAGVGHLPYYGYGVGLPYYGLPVVSVKAAEEPAAEAADVMVEA